MHRPLTVFANEGSAKSRNSMHGNGGELGGGYTELPHQPEGDFVVLPLTQEHPAAGVKPNVRQIAQSKVLQFAVNQGS